MITLIILTLLAGIGIALAGVFFKSEEDAAEPVEPPTRHEIKEGNLSPEIPVAEDPKNRT